jgi:GNAT superfamily N-acetyltransferase
MTPFTRRFAVRVATDDDVRAVAPLFDAYRRFYGCAEDPTAARDFLAMRRARGEATLLVAAECRPDTPDTPDGARSALVGFAQLYPSFSSVSLAVISILNDLFVIPEWRRASVARQLVLAAAAHAAQHGACRLALSTQHANIPARRLYASLGFAPDLEFTHLSLDLRPAPGTEKEGLTARSRGGTS